MSSPEDVSTLQKGATWLRGLAIMFIRGQPTQKVELNEECTAPSPSRATFSPKSAVSSLRMHLPRHKRGSLHGIKYGQPATFTGAEGPERFSTDSEQSGSSHRPGSLTGSFASSVRGFGRSQKRRFPPSELTALKSTESANISLPTLSLIIPTDAPALTLDLGQSAFASPTESANIPLPTSPINIPTKAPVLTLDLGPSAFASPTLCMQFTDPSNLMTGFSSEAALCIPPELFSRGGVASSAEKADDSPITTTGEPEDSRPSDFQPLHTDLENDPYISAAVLLREMDLSEKENEQPASTFTNTNLHSHPNSYQPLHTDLGSEPYLTAAVPSSETDPSEKENKPPSPTSTNTATKKAKIRLINTSIGRFRQPRVQVRQSSPTKKWSVPDLSAADVRDTSGCPVSPLYSSIRMDGNPYSVLESCSGE